MIVVLIVDGWLIEWLIGSLVDYKVDGWVVFGIYLLVGWLVGCGDGIW